LHQRLTMLVRRLLSAGLLSVLLAVPACASQGEEDDATEDALRAPRPGDVEVPLLGQTPASNAPAKFAAVASWSIDYVEMRDPNPDNQYRGMMLYARDAKGELLYLAPLGWSGAAAAAPLGETDAPIEAFLYHAEPDEYGNLIPVTFDVGETRTAERIAAEKASIDWLLSEERRLIGLIPPPAPSKGGIGIRADRPVLDGVECAARIASLFLATNPVLYFLVDGGIDVARGLIDGSGEKVASGVVKGGFAGVAQVIKKKAGQKALNRTILGVIGVGVGYNVYKHGVVGGLAQTAKDLIPESCRNTAARLIR
jgi:hypothetical protein